jgi:hypothetical protein
LSIEDDYGLGINVDNGTVDIADGVTVTEDVTVNGGVLHIAGTASVTEDVTVNGGTLEGEGSVGGLLTVASGGTVSPGSSPGTMSASNEIWAGGSTYLWQINDFGGTAGSDPGWDLLSVGNTLTINATDGDELVIDITSLTLGNVAGDAAGFDFGEYAFLIADAGNDIVFDAAGSFSEDLFSLVTGDFTNDTRKTSWGIALGSSVDGGDATELYLTASVIPEPTSALLLGLAAAVLCRRRAVRSMGPFARRSHLGEGGGGCW